MNSCKSTFPFIGDKVYIYSTSLDEVIEGIVEGYADESKRRYKVLQFLDIEDSTLRHIVSYIYVFDNLGDALKCKEDNNLKSSTIVRAGNVVYLLDKLRNPVVDRHGVPCQYQVVSVYSETSKAGLVTSYGEYIGLHDISQLLYVTEGPIFKREDYKVGSLVVWVDGEDVYEGVIQTLHSATATIRNVKKLYSVDYEVRIPYWKIPEGRQSDTDSTSEIIHTVIGDDLD